MPLREEEKSITLAANTTEGSRLRENSLPSPLLRNDAVPVTFSLRVASQVRDFVEHVSSAIVLPLSQSRMPSADKLIPKEACITMEHTGAVGFVDNFASHGHIGRELLMTYCSM